MVAQSASLPAPVGGWNARDALAEMAPTDAVSMVNWWPMPTDVMMRKGYSNFATGIGAPTQVESLLVYAAPTADKMFAAAGAAIYDASSAGAVGAAAVSGLTSARWQYINFGTSGGNFLLAVNGSDKPLLYNGSQWSTMDSTTTAATATTTGTVVTVTAANTYIVGQTVTTAGFGASFNGDFVVASVIGPAGAQTGFTYNLVAAGPCGGPGTVISKQAITGLTAANAVHINAHKHRVWLTAKNSLSAWYLGVDSISGAATEFPLQGVARSGGYLVGMATWTGDAGFGADDLAAFITSKGEVIVYQGTDPSSANTWALKGVWQIGSPVGRRPFVKWAGDLLLLSQDGLVPMWSELQSSRLDPRVALTDKIYSAVSSAVSLYGSNFGWEIVPWPKTNMLVVNVPVATGSQEQYVMNTITKAWARFKGWAANTFALYKDDMYFGGNGVVCKAWDTFSDNATNISSDLQQAFQYLKDPGRVKRFTLMRPTISTDGNPPIYAGINLDYDVTVPTSTLTQPTVVTGASWDTADWDTAVWAGDLQIIKLWQGVAGVGFAVAPHYVLNCQGIETHLVSTDLIYERGGAL